MSSTQTPSRKMQLPIDLRVVVAVLFLVIVVMLFVWKPWAGGSAANTRSIKVTGESTITAEPDRFVFYPAYEFNNADRSVALADMNKKSDEIVAKLKGLGVADNQIKTNANGANDRLYYAPNSGSTSNTYTLQITITVKDRTMAQKVQDYLVTTAPSGMVTPVPSFSDAKRKSLETDGRNKATQDARAKAEQSAKNLGAKLDKVKSISDDLGGTTPVYNSQAVGSTSLDDTRLSVQPGQNEFAYSVTVEFYLK